MGGAPHIGLRLRDGPIFEESVSRLDEKERPGKIVFKINPRRISFYVSVYYHSLTATYLVYESNVRCYTAFQTYVLCEKRGMGLGTRLWISLKTLCSPASASLILLILIKLLDFRW
jgi:hypothetical protein